ncbi:MULTISPECIES: hypothetical protein [Rhizobium]|uniref:PH domain-containing protein n=1 Tax=Rhizobium rhododendri TaxID=2506430 RepID=A0ABY8INP1_9HYPH|nr:MULTISPECIES: hypothetical protein [Rhizobium]TQX86836.1 hypothetical protein EQW76_16980 [Rhizobium sp. rho-13.1]TQY11444.1 hypothetical protein EQW74_18295 [Rhizobium sp. rho-1.1]WFS25050.1 hypothetical protein PR018_22450 [Rhizobium rhododendri]
MAIIRPNRSKTLSTAVFELNDPVLVGTTYPDEIVIYCGSYRELWRSVIVCAVLVACYTANISAQQHGFFRESDMLNHWVTGLFCVFLSILGWSVGKRNPWKPLFTVRTDGIVYHRFSGQIIYWSSIKQVTLRAAGVASQASMIDILIKDEADPILVRRATVKSALFSHVPGKPNISIPDQPIGGLPCTDLKSMLLRAHYQHSHPDVDATNVVSLCAFRSKKSQLKSLPE